MLLGGGTSTMAFLFFSVGGILSVDIICTLVMATGSCILLASGKIFPVGQDKTICKVCSVCSAYVNSIMLNASQEVFHHSLKNGWHCQNPKWKTVIAKQPLMGIDGNECFGFLDQLHLHVCISPIKFG